MPPLTCQSSINGCTNNCCAHALLTTPKTLLEAMNRYIWALLLAFPLALSHPVLSLGLHSKLVTVCFAACPTNTRAWEGYVSATLSEKVLVSSLRISCSSTAHACLPLPRQNSQNGALSAAPHKAGRFTDAPTEIELSHTAFHCFAPQEDLPRNR